MYGTPYMPSTNKADCPVINLKLSTLLWNSWAIKVMILANRNCRTALDHTMISAVGTLQILPLYTWNTALQKVQSLGRIHSFDWEITMSCPYVSELPSFQRLQNRDRTSAWEATNNRVAECLEGLICALGTFKFWHLYHHKLQSFVRVQVHKVLGSHAFNDQATAS